MNRNRAGPKPVIWVGSSRRDLRELPEPVQKNVGRILGIAQYGRKEDSVKPLAGFGGASVLEIRDNYDSDTFRAIYTVRFAERIYVLHVFQKKSRSGIQTSRHDVGLIQERLKAAESLHEDWLAERRKAG